MDKISLVSSFQKSIEALKNTECSPKEKLAHFANISDFITTPSIQTHPNHIKFVSTSLAVLLMFCEEMDSTIHLNAEENLYKIIRFCEKTFIVRIQYDLYHEIKKNGNERSLRICLNIFGYYCHLIKQRKVKPYATNFLPCIYAISKRKETPLIETLCEFLKIFGKFMENCLSDRDILKLVEVFVNDTISDCSIKRRCASQNVMTLMINSKKPDFICRQAVNKSLDILTSDQSVNTAIGVLGLLRLLIPQLACDASCDFMKIIQILDVCLQLLHDKSHSIINASLEVIHAILRCPKKKFKNLLTSMDHIDVIRKEDSLKNLIFKKCGNKTNLSKLLEIDRNYFEMNNSRDLECSSFSKETQILDDACLSCTDIEMDSLKSIDSSQEIENLNKKSDTTSLKSQKSTESFGSFFNSLLSQSKPTETVSKFLRSQGSSLTNTPKKTNIDDISSVKSFPEDDVMSVKSLDSHVSTHTNCSSPVVVVPGNEADETITVVELEPLPDDDQPVLDVIRLPMETCKLDESTESIKSKEISIGSIYDQFLIDYVVRLICYKFLLGGQDQKLKLDNSVRVSIQNLSIIVLADCVRIRPQILLMKLTQEIVRPNETPRTECISNDSHQNTFDVMGELCLTEKSNQSCENNLLDIKLDHFGESNCNVVEFLSPLSECGGSPCKTVDDTFNETSKCGATGSLFIDVNNDLEVEKSDQSVQDVLLYFNHHDPSLRGNVQSIIGNFIFAVMENYRNFDELCQDRCNDVENKFINLDLLLKILIQGLSDDIHTVIKHSLTSIELIFPAILSTLAKSQHEIENFSFQKCKLNDLNVTPTEHVRIDQILNELLIVGNNKNWVVQSKYCELVANINFNEIRKFIGDDLGWYYENKFLESIYALIGDQDSRTRSSATSSLCRYIKQEQHDYAECDQNLAIGNYVCSRVFNGLPMAFEGFKLEHFERTKRLQHKFSKVLYTLSNKLLELSNRNQQFGVICAIAELLKIFNPIRYHKIWNEFSVFDTCLSFMYENYSVATDATCQSDLIFICTNLLAGNAFDLTYKWTTQINTLLLHILKLLNIFNHVFNNIRPLYIPKGQKNDIFISTKEFQIFDSFGYFGNDYFYRKIYKLLKQCFDSYKISIAKDTGQLVMDLLSKTLSSFTVLLEIKIPEQTSNPIKLIEEALTYLTTLINYAPKESVIVIRQLLKYMFSMNLRSRKTDFEYLVQNVIQNECADCDAAEVTKVLTNLSTSSGTTSSEKAAHILLFKPIVIRCLKIFSKSDSSIQSAILDMLCQALEFNVNYALLDANNVFLDFVLKLSELIETGTVRESEVVVASIIKFLFCLTKEKDRKLISIPKIINITDTLLANDVKSGSQALNELAFKFFFEDTFCDDVEFSLKDINTQKEVALRMLMKFLHIKEIQHSLCVISILQRSTTNDNENSFYVNLLQVLEDNRGLLTDVEQYVSMELCFKILNESTLMEESNLRKVFSIVFNGIYALQEQTSIETCSVNLILLENVLSKVAEDSYLKEAEQYLSEHLKHSHPVAVSFVAELIFQFIKSVLDLYVDDRYDQQTSTLFERLLKVQFGLEKLNTVKDRLATEFVSNNIVAKYLNKLLPNVRKAFLEFLFVINYDRLEILNILMNMKDPEVCTYATITLNACVEVDDLDEQEIYFAIKHLDVLSYSCEKMLTKILNSSKYFSDVMDRIDILMEQKLSKETQEAIHTLLSKCDVLENYPRIMEASLKLVNFSKLQIFKVQTKKLIFEKLSSLSTFSGGITKILPESTFVLLRQFSQIEEVNQSLTHLIEDLQQFYDNPVEERSDVCNSENMDIVDASWLIEQINYNSFNAFNDNNTLAELLFEVTSEKQLSNILASSQFNICHLQKFIKFSFQFVENTFKHDCMQFNPHLNYLKIPALLKYSLITLLEHIQSLNRLVSTDQNDAIRQLIDVEENVDKYESAVKGLITFLECVDKLEQTCLTFIELKLIEKYFKQNLLKEEMFETLVNFGTTCFLYVSNLLTKVNMTRHDIGISFRCADLILKHMWLWNVINNSEKYLQNVEIMVNVLYETIKIQFDNTNLMSKFEIENLAINSTTEIDKKAAFIAKFVEIRSKNEANDYFNLEVTYNISKGHSSRMYARTVIFTLHFSVDENGEELVTSLIVSVLRTNKFYVFAIAPIEILNFDLDIPKSKLTAIPSIPIEYLNEADVLELFVKRLQIFGYTSRHQFEEFFMSLLVLFNTEVEIEIVDNAEQYQIRNMCMTAIMELLISLKVTTNLGSAKNKFHHLPRGSPIKLNSISHNKLHKVLLKLPNSNVFYLPNAERICLQSNDNITGTEKFLKNQLDLNCVWQIVEEMEEKKLNLSLRNSRHLIEVSGIDFKSSFQLIFDVFGQLIETNYSLIFPHLAKMSEICEQREQYRWIKNISLKMQEVVPMTNIVVHQSIIYCLCKSSAVLIPALSELTAVCSLIHVYLKSSYLCIRIATLKGLLCLLESCVKTNTTIGSLSEELSLIRNVIIQYTNNNGIVEESKFMFSEEHTKLVWTLNMYLIETTSKFVNDSSIISNTVISANNILKRTNNIDQYLSILHGLQRLIVSNVDENEFRNKIEKISLHLFKSDNEAFSIPALKLLITCLYINSNDQLKNTENSNGIVQDEPEVILQSTERIDLLFQRIKHSTPSAGTIYGNVLCQMIRDLVPPNEILTKVIKELLTLNQPQCKVIAKILFQVFRSAIDSASLTLLQEWLICSFPNFLMCPVNKAVWCLNVILVSASINQYLVKIFPEILENVNVLNDRQVMLFRLFAKDFYNRLNGDQRLKFKNVLSNCNYEIIKNALT